jgi:divalent metal cation (Fe/Co/Zn/Cd) transporter
LFVFNGILFRFETGGTWRETLSRWIGLQRGGLALLIAICGTCATVIMTKFEEYLSTDLSKDSNPQTASINAWHWLSAVRAVCAVAGWLLIALQPTANFTRDQLLAMAVSFY